MRFKFIPECMFFLLLITGCNRDFHENSRAVAPRTPFNYNTPNVYVFSIKATNADHAQLYADTLGFMCTNATDHLNHGFTKTSWLFLSASQKDTYVLNPNKYSNSSDGTLCSTDSLFMHPPRDDQYRILETCPYPFLRFPLYIGKKWDWILDVGSMWCPSKNLSWKGVETFTSKYEVIDTPAMPLLFGKATCYHIHATNDSKFGTSSAEFYYSFIYGFVKMDYHPLDRTEVVFDLLTTTNDPGLFKSVIPNYQEGEEFMDLMKK